MRVHDPKRLPARAWEAEQRESANVCERGHRQESTNTRAPDGQVVGLSMHGQA